MKLFFYMAAALLTFAVIPFLAKRGGRLGKRRAYLMIFCSALFFSSVFAGAGDFFAKFGGPGGLYAAEITPDVPSLTIPLYGAGEITLEARNRGSVIWDSAAESEPVFLGWHLLNEKGGMVRFDNPRVSLPTHVSPGDSVSVAVRISPAPDGIPAGRFIIEFDLVCENVAWFADRGSATCRVPVEIVP